MSDTRLRSLLPKPAIWLIVGLIIVFLTSSGLSLEPKVTLSILLPAIQAPYWEELIKDFSKENPGIRIIKYEVADQTNLAQDNYVKEPKDSTSNPSLRYDLVFMDIIWVSEFVEKGLLVNLNDKQYMTPEEFKELKADFLPKDLEGGLGGLYKDKLYRIPFHSDVGVLFYRKDLFANAKYELPKTFEELMKISKELQNKHPELSGYVWQGMQYEGLVAMFVEVLEGYGGFWIRGDKQELDRDPAIRAVDFLHKAIYDKEISPPGVTTFTERETTSVLKKREAVFVRNWVFWDETNGPGSEIQDKYNFVPMVHEGNNKSGSCQGGWGLGIASSSNHKKEAWTAIKFFTSVATQKKYALKTGNMPSRRSLLNDLQLVKKYSYYPRLLEISKNSVLRPSTFNYSCASKILQKHLSSVLNDPKNSTEEKIKNEMIHAARKTRELLKRSKPVDPADCERILQSEQ